MSFVAVATIGAGVAGAVISSRSTSRASDAQVESTEQGIGEQRRQFDLVQEILSPYVDAGEGGLQGMLNLSGANGDEAYNSAIAQIESGPQYESLVRNGEAAIIGNASATGGMRGGNTQAALAEFRPEMLSRLIDQKYQQYGGIANLGQASAAGVGNAAQSTGNAVSGLYQQQGAAIAGNAIGQGQIVNGLIGDVAGLVTGGGFNRGGSNTGAPGTTGGTF